MKVLLFHNFFRARKSSQILTTIISEGSKTMHSQPRLKLPAERLPKLERKRDLRNINCEFKPTLQINRNEKLNNNKKTHGEK